MCGLAGVLDLKGRRWPDQAMLQRMADTLRHRGPDDDGFLVAAGIGLAHRRLSIVGLGDGRQPIFNEDRSVAVICNGELFDFVERRAELKAKGHVFRTHSDSEIMVHLYEEHGEGLFQHLKGQFAFVLVDFEHRTVLLARDRVGICPLFWSQQGDQVYFGSEIKALFASGAVAPGADPRGLDHLFTFFALGTRRTMFEGVQAVAPGHYLKIAWRGDDRAATPVEIKYWDFDFPDWGEEDDPEPASAIAEFEQTFARAVELRLRADVPVVGYLSGGVDFGLCAGDCCTSCRSRAAKFHHTYPRSLTRRGGASRRGCTRHRRSSEYDRSRAGSYYRHLRLAHQCGGKPSTRHVLRRVTRTVRRGAGSRLQGSAHRRGRRRRLRRLSLV